MTFLLKPLYLWVLTAVNVKNIKKFMMVFIIKKVIRKIKML